VAESTAGYQVNISFTQEVGTPDLIHRLNQFDEHGSILSLDRLRGEKNWQYKRRILDTFVHMANCSYQGLMYGITRELGLSLFNAIEISPVLDVDGQYITADPYIKFDGAYLLLYSDFTNDALDWAVDRYQSGGNYEHIGALVDMVNSTSRFQATLRAGIDPYTRSMSILNQSNREIVRLEFLPESTRFKLKNDRLVEGSVFFANKKTFKTEVTTTANISTRGEYHVDYSKGIVTVYTTPNPQESVRYQYSKVPLVATASPVILNDINNETFRVKMFEQFLQDNGNEAHGLPTELGVDIINELMSVNPMYWGV